MEKTLIGTRSAADEAGRIFQFFYYRLEEKQCYGVCVRARNGETASVADLTEDRRRIDALLGVMMRGTVTPVSLRDVVVDWLNG